MKIFVVLPVSIVLVSIMFCPMVRAAPPIPDYVQIVNPDPSLPKELSALFGKYEAISAPFTFFLIVAKIDEEKATLHIWRDGSPYAQQNGWETINAQVVKEGGKYQLLYRNRFNLSCEVYLKGKYLHITTNFGIVRYTRVP